jgi:hypothetical protein
MRRDSASSRRVAVLVGALLWTAAPAGAATPPPSPPPAPDDAAIYQYRESLPASGGPVVPDGAARGGQPLAPALARQLEQTAGSDAPLLERVATSPALGAPVSRRRGATPVPASAEPVADDEPAAGDALGAAAGALDGNARLLVLLGAMLLLGGAAVAASAPQRRSS